MCPCMILYSLYTLLILLAVPQVHSTFTDITALKAFTKNAVFGPASGYSLVKSPRIVIIEDVPQLAQDLSAALDETNTHAATATATATAAATSTPISPRTPTKPWSPAVLKKQCDTLQALSQPSRETLGLSHAQPTVVPVSSTSQANTSRPNRAVWETRRTWVNHSVASRQSSKSPVIKSLRPPKSPRPVVVVTTRTPRSESLISQKRFSLVRRQFERLSKYVEVATVLRR